MTQKELFPFFKNNDLVYLDSAATTQKPEIVLKALNNAYINTSNVSRSSYLLASKNQSAINETRNAVANYLSCKDENIIFTQSATDGINFVSLSINLKKDEKILVSYLEHHSNYLPFVTKFKNNLLVCKLDENGDIDLKNFKELLSKNKVKFVSITGFSNCIGRIQPIKEMIRLSHTYGAKILIDATQLIANEKINVKDLDCDFLVFSAHKIYGPFGVGILYSKEPFENNYRTGGGTVSDVKDNIPNFVSSPQVYEAGTLAIPEIISLKSAIEFLNKQDLSYSKKLVSKAKKELLSLGAKIVGEPEAGCICFYFDKIASYDISLLLGNMGVYIRSGTHCCAPLHHYLKIPSTLRISFGVYNDEDDIKKATEKLKQALKVLGYDK